MVLCPAIVCVHTICRIWVVKRRNYLSIERSSMLFCHYLLLMVSLMCYYNVGIYAQSAQQSIDGDMVDNVTALMRAAQKGDITSVKHLIEHGANVNAIIGRDFP